MLEVKASELPRVMVCGGSLPASRMVEFVPPDNDSMKEGTAGHEVVEALFRDTEPPELASNGVPIDDDMLEYARDYVKAVRLQAPEILPETRLDWYLTPEILVKVKPDAVFWPDEVTLCVDDYKYGWRVVDVEDNWQLIAGAIGAIRKNAEQGGKTPERIVTGVYQPRPYHRQGPYRRQVFTLDQLRVKHDELLAKLSTPTDELCTGEQCVQCPVARAASCPAWRQAAYNAVDVAMRGVSEEPDAETLAKELTMFRRAGEVMKQSLQYVEDITKARIEAGQIVPGYTLEKAYGHRFFPDFDKFVESLKEGSPPEFPEGITLDKLYEKPKPLSPAKLEKLPGVTRETTDPYTKTPSRGHRVVELKIDVPPPPPPVDKTDGKD